MTIGKEQPACSSTGDELLLAIAGLAFPVMAITASCWWLPDISYLREYRSAIAGISVTHGHDRSLRGIPHHLKALRHSVISLWPRLPLSMLARRKRRKRRFTDCTHHPDGEPRDLVQVACQHFSREFIRTPTHADSFAWRSPSVGVLSSPATSSSKSPPVELGDTFDISGWARLRRIQGCLCLLVDSHQRRASRRRRPGAAACVPNLIATCFKAEGG